MWARTDDYPRTTAYEDWRKKFAESLLFSERTQEQYVKVRDAWIRKMEREQLYGKGNDITNLCRVR